MHGRFAGRRVRRQRRRSLHGERQRVRGRLPGGGLHVPGLGGPVRRGGDLPGDVGRVPGGRVRVIVDPLHGRLAGRRVRRQRRRSLHGERQRVRGRLPGDALQVSGLGGPVRRGGDLPGDVGRVPGGRVRVIVDPLHGRLAGRRVRRQRRRSLHGERQRVRGRLPGDALQVSGLGGPVRRGGDLPGDVGRVPGGRVRVIVDPLHGRLAGRRVRRQRRRSLHGERQRVRGRLPGDALQVSGLGGPVRRGGDLPGDVGRVPGGRVRVIVDPLHGRLAGRRVRRQRRRSLHGERQRVRGRLPGDALQVSGLGGPVRRGGGRPVDLGRVPGGRVRVIVDPLHGRLAGRRVRRQRRRSLHGERQRVRGRLPGGGLHVPGLGGPVRRGGDVPGDVGRVPGGRVRVVVDPLHGRLAGRRVRRRHRRPLHGDQQRVRGRLPGGGDDLRR